MTAMRSQSFVFDPLPDGNGLKMAANRYTSGDSPLQTAGLTLILAHGSGLHKECWEPTLSKLFQIQASEDRSCRIREAWAFDWQSHGDSALLNESAARKDPISTLDWGLAINEFAKSEHVRGHRLVLIGHSAGASAVMCCAKFHIEKHVLYSGIILVEPLLIDKDVYHQNLEDRELHMKAVAKIVASVRSVWKSTDDAFQWMSRRPPWNTWDPRVLRIHANHGLRPARDEKGDACVAVKCSDRYEASTFSDLENVFAATDLIGAACQSMPVYAIFGEINDFVPRYSQDSVVDVSKGRHVRSIIRMPGVGHMIVQEKPDVLAATLWDVLVDAFTFPHSARL
ncbi:Esterase/lipase/thioesterase [Heterobasidion irregulare TC 32-1]|uniref:Esterase/lipase/thioesterase n=1 Tax=Heterobasidion irregulare (strain TC 32-1) TaxID=747525 RepID=W4KN57_HETIT|nr:Esterase/lipase/thioesterase [Heterobasidion irregulare TC 32-1]ETW87252.1 Esterase/lipase/thioesterase [Heterobasidion irregulare TC 32-1]